MHEKRRWCDPFLKLSEVTVTRKRPLSSGGGEMRTTLDFLTLITEGNESQNISFLMETPLSSPARQRNFENRLLRPGRATSTLTLFRST